MIDRATTNGWTPLEPDRHPTGTSGSSVGVGIDILDSELVSTEAAVPMLRVSGEIDAATAGQFHDLLSTLDAGDTAIWIDLRGISFFTAAGCSALAAFVDRCVREDTAVHVMPSEAVRRVLAVCGLDDLLR